MIDFERITSDPLAQYDAAFIKDLMADDELGAVIRGHIHVEASVNDYLELILPYPDQLPNLRYEQKIRVAAAAGLDIGLLPSLKELGDLRNSFGHNLKAKLAKDKVAKLHKCLDVRVRGILETYQSKVHTQILFKDLPPKDQFTFIVMAIKVGLIAEILMTKQLLEAGGRITEADTN